MELLKKVIDFNIKFVFVDRWEVDDLRRFVLLVVGFK